MNSEPRKVPARSTVAVLPDHCSVEPFAAYQRIIRTWSGYLSIYELMVALVIADRTLGWRKTRATFSTVKMLSGDGCYSGLPMGRTAMFEALASLERKGIIHRYPIAGHYIRSYSINIGWCPDAVKHASDRKKQSATRTAPSVTRTIPVRHTDTGEGKQGEGNLGKVIAVSASPRPVLSSEDLVRTEIETDRAGTRARHEAKTQTLPDQIVGLEAAWRRAMDEAFPQVGYAAWSVREKAQVKAKLKTWIAKDCPMTGFVEWTVTNWAAIVAKQFRWMTKSPAPTVPEIGFLLSFMSQFIECRAEGKLEQWLAAPERTERDKLRATGKSDDEAAAEIGRRRAVEGMRKEIEKVRIEALARVRQARIIEQQAHNIATMPIHPRSRAAQEAREAQIVNPPPRRPRTEENMRRELLEAPTLDPNWEPPLV